MLRNNPSKMYFYPRVLIYLGFACALLYVSNGKPVKAAALKERIFFLTKDFPERSLTLSSVDTDGSDRKDIVRLPFKTLVTSNTVQSDVVFSPDGTKIVFELILPNSNIAHDIALIDLNKPEVVTQLTHANPADPYEDYSVPRFSPDGRQVVFSGERKAPRGSKNLTQRNIYIVNADGSGFQQLTQGDTDADYWPFFSTDGQRIIFYGENGLMQMNPDGTNQQILLSKAKFPSVRGALAEAISPDGTKFVYAGQEKSGDEPDLYLLDLQTSKTINLTNTPLRRDSHPTFSPDGSKILFRTRLSNSIYEVGFGQGDIKIVNADGSGQQNITNDDDYEIEPTFSPDGNRIAFTYGPTIYEGVTIHTMNLDGSNEKDLLPGKPFKDESYLPVWKAVQVSDPPPPPPPPPITATFKGVKGKLTLHRGRVLLTLQGALQPKTVSGAVQLALSVKGVKKPLLKTLKIKNGSFRTRMIFDKRFSRAIKKAHKGKMTLNYSGLTRNGRVEITAATLNQLLKLPRRRK